MPPQDTAHQPTAFTPGAQANTIAQQTPLTGDTTDHRGLLVGQRIGPYELLQRIGRGGLGDVYRARHAETGEEVALKLLRGGDEASPAEIRSFRREIDAARRLAHPGVLPIRDVGYRDGLPYYAMPLIHGGTLEKRLRRAGRGAGRCRHPHAGRPRRAGRPRPGRDPPRPQARQRPARQATSRSWPTSGWRLR